MCQKKQSTTAFLAAFDSVSKERRARKIIIAFTLQFFGGPLTFFFLFENQYFCKTTFRSIVAAASLSSTIQNAHFHIVTIRVYILIDLNIFFLNARS